MSRLWTGLRLDLHRSQLGKGNAEKAALLYEHVLLVNTDANCCGRCRHHREEQGNESQSFLQLMERHKWHVEETDQEAKKAQKSEQAIETRLLQVSAIAHTTD